MCEGIIVLYVCEIKTSYVYAGNLYMCINHYILNKYSGFFMWK